MYESQIIRKTNLCQMSRATPQGPAARDLRKS